VIKLDKTITVTFSDINRLNSAPLNQLASYYSPEMKPEDEIKASFIERKEIDCEIDSFLTAAYLNQVAQATQSNCQKRFVCQDQLSNDPRYYEEIIFEDDVIPTRASTWHDFFNGLMWLSFNKTKAYMNQLHIEQSKRYGLVPRTKVRNHVTHFDECGLVLFIHGDTLLKSLHAYFSEQNWDAIFVSLKAHWHKQIMPVVIGHANYEMLLKPFIGLTGKVLLVSTPESLLDSQKSNGELKAWQDQRVEYDHLLHKHLIENAVFEQNKPFYPLPILGVPGWHYEAQTSAFYANKQYFMPKRRS
jgi:hypothetical protein